MQPQDIFDFEALSLAEKISYIQNNPATKDLTTLAAKSSRRVINYLKKCTSQISSQSERQRCVTYMSLLDRLIVALTSFPCTLNNQDENRSASAAIQTLLSHLNPNLVPHEWNGYFAERLLSSVEDHLSSLNEYQSKNSLNQASCMDGSVFAFLPFFFNNLNKTTRLFTRNENAELLNVKKSRNRLITRLTNCYFWTVYWAAELLSQIRQIDFSVSELRAICLAVNSKILIVTTPLKQIPSIVSEYVSLAKHPNCSTDLVMIGILDLFNQLNVQVEAAKQQENLPIDSEEELKETENLVQLTLDQAFSKHAKLLFETIKFASSVPLESIGIFTIGVLLMVIRDGHMDSYKKLVEQAVDVLTKWLFCQFVEIIHDHCTPEKRELTPPFKRKVEQIVHKVETGWELCVSGLIQLTFKFMIKISNDRYVARLRTTCKLPAYILSRIFNSHPHTRSSIIDEIFRNVTSKTELSVFHALVLHQIVSTNLREVLAYMPKITENLYALPFLSPSVSGKLVRALDPVIRLHPGFRDQLLVIFRKGTFSRDVSYRTVSVVGILELLRNVVRILCVKRVMLPAQAESLGLEMIAFLKRCLTQQCGIRAVLYRDLSLVFCKTLKFEQSYAPKDQSIDSKDEAISRALGSIQDAALELLSAQMWDYIHESHEKSYLELNRCFKNQTIFTAAQKTSIHNSCFDPSRPTLVEPYHLLIHAANHCILNSYTTKRSDHQALCLLLDPMNQIVKACVENDLEEFELSAEDNTWTDGAASMLLGVYEMCIEYLIISNQRQHEIPVSDQSRQEIISRYEKILQIFDRHAALYAIITDRRHYLKTAKSENNKASCRLKGEKEVQCSNIDSSSEKKKTVVPSAFSSSKKHEINIEPTFSRKCIADLMLLICTSSILDIPEPDEQIKELHFQISSRPYVHQYVLTAVLSQLNLCTKGEKSASRVAATSTRDEDEASVLEASKKFSQNVSHDDFVRLVCGPLFYQLVSSRIMTDSGNDEKNSRKAMARKRTARLAAECYVKILEYVQEGNYFVQQEAIEMIPLSVALLSDRFPLAGEIIDTTDERARVSKFVTFVHNQMTLESTNCSRQWSVLNGYLSIFSVFLPILETSKCFLLYEWLVKWLSSEVFEAKGFFFLSELIRLIWKVLERCDLDRGVEFLSELAVDLFCVCECNTVYELNDCQQAEDRVLENRMKGVSKYAGVTKMSAPTVANALIQILHSRWTMYRGAYRNLFDQEMEECVNVTSSGDMALAGESEVAPEENGCGLASDKKMYHVVKTIGVMSRLASVKLPSGSCVPLAKLIELAFKVIHEWLSYLARSRQTKPATAQLESLIDALFFLFDRLNNFILYWTQGGASSAWSEEDEDSACRDSADRLVGQSATDIEKQRAKVFQNKKRANKYAPQLVYWMEKLHAEDLIELIARIGKSRWPERCQRFINRDWCFVGTGCKKKK
ncbi:uncharacterized protein LOC126316667 [Schistocerca gregaria]|uniref:uncharacterized protein LOC126316667 n=1 Tax=Schistocerca gregaria TaxID=7010 RepID=UPI00211DF8BD|nr:uncharacterized protein LOC126316667 [Schistocerca gregaria]